MNLKKLIGCTLAAAHFEQIISSMPFKVCNNTSPLYMNGRFKPAGPPNTPLLEHLC